MDYFSRSVSKEVPFIRHLLTFLKRAQEPLDSFVVPSVHVQAKEVPSDFNFFTLIRRSVKASANIRLEDEDLGIDLGGEEDDMGKGKHRDPLSTGPAPFIAIPECSSETPPISPTSSSLVKPSLPGRNDWDNRVRMVSAVNVVKLRRQRLGLGRRLMHYAHVLSHGTAIEADADATDSPSAVRRGSSTLPGMGKLATPLSTEWVESLPILAGQPKGNYAEDLMKAHDVISLTGTYPHSQLSLPPDYILVIPPISLRNESQVKEAASQKSSQMTEVELEAFKERKRAALKRHYLKYVKPLILIFLLLVFFCHSAHIQVHGEIGAWTYRPCQMKLRVGVFSEPDKQE
ncbi:hypothetical protein BT96DRAFT_1000775 [Gymnopus androsaceus JB14]|uniref:Uncharacterized protein n=1 Tax=Gymnopus androsaceus JB14 TaxID=1447944 RepID=A0A6A4H3W8_9AGAR|nr:hypothetical protein BT96DRAFT_1000775 [Gymnopus androsaceus JB14]